MNNKINKEIHRKQTHQLFLHLNMIEKKKKKKKSFKALKEQRTTRYETRYETPRFENHKVAHTE